jgi:hypothetical protein
MEATNFENIISSCIPMPVCMINSNGKITNANDKIGEVFPRLVYSFALPSPGAITVPGIAEWIKKINAEGGIKADTFKRIEVDFGEKVLLRVYNDEHRNYIRFGVNQNGGGIQQETVVVDKDGYLDKNTPFMFDYDKVTRVDAFKIDVEPIVVEGGTFITYPYLTDKPQGGYTIYERGIYCARSNVTFRNIKHVSGNIKIVH